MKRTISIDFDGVLHDYSAGWQGYVPTGAPIAGSQAFVRACATEGLEIIVSTCRAYTQIGREAVRAWLERYDFPAEFMHVTCEKPHADWYVDDRGIRFQGDFAAVWEQMKQPVWFKQGTDRQFGESEQ